MKRSILVTLLTLLLSCNEVSKEDQNRLIETEESEVFNQFLENFSRMEKFQLSRIEFPLQDCDFGSEEEGCKKIRRTDWVFLDLLPDSDPPITIINIYDNFDLEVQNTGERVLAFEATDTNVCTLYYFKLINDKWFLVKRETCTD